MLKQKTGAKIIELVTFMKFEAPSITTTDNSLEQESIILLMKYYESFGAGADLGNIWPASQGDLASSITF